MSEDKEPNASAFGKKDMMRGVFGGLEVGVWRNLQRAEMRVRASLLANSKARVRG